MNWFLEIADETSAARFHPLALASPAIVGREEQCAVRLTGRRVSRRHCQLTPLGDGWQIDDLGSNNGTFVNDRRVQSANLQTGDVIGVGGVTLRLVLERGDEETLDHFPERPAAAKSRRTSPGSAANAPANVVLGRRYALKQVLHRGSTGVFYRALDGEGKSVCVKVLSKQFAADEAHMKRFVRGVRSAAPLRHPNIVSLFQAGRSGSQWWLAMELVDGPSLRKLAAEAGIGNMLPSKRVYGIACDIAQALCAASERGLLHRNIKPDSVLLSADGTAKLGNFTLGRGAVLETLDQITRSGELIGDLAYMPPERAEPDGVCDARSDLYSLGACLYHVLTGKPPFSGRGTVDLLHRLRHDAPVAPSKFNLALPAPLESVVLKCLAKSPDDRFRSPEELSAELARIGRFQGLAG